MSRSDRRLARQKKALPDASADTTQTKNASDRVQGYAAAHRDPNAATGAQREMMEQTKAPPGPIPNVPETNP